MPPPSCGGVLLLEMLNLLERYDLGALPRDGAALAHLLAEAMSFAFADRSRWLGDPDVVAIPVAWLTSRAEPTALRALIRPDAVVPLAELGGAAVAAPEPGHTTHLSVVDAEGDAVAATLTINLSFGSGMMAPGTGRDPQRRDGRLRRGAGRPQRLRSAGRRSQRRGAGPPAALEHDPDHPAARRPRRCWSPAAPAVRASSPRRCRRSSTSSTSAWTRRAAVAWPRLHQQWWPPVLYVEAGAVGAAARDTLAAIGHVLATVPALGNAQLVSRRPRRAACVRGASDPRGVGAAAGTSPPAPGAAR